MRNESQPGQSSECVRTVEPAQSEDKITEWVNLALAQSFFSNGMTSACQQRNTMEFFQSETNNLEICVISFKYVIMYAN